MIALNLKAAFSEILQSVQFLSREDQSLLREDRKWSEWEITCLLYFLGITEAWFQLEWTEEREGVKRLVTAQGEGFRCFMIKV